MKLIKKCKENTKIQTTIIIIDAISILILGLITIVINGNMEGAFFDYVSHIFYNFTLPIMLLSFFTVISIFFIDLKKNWIVFLPIYLLDLISVFGNSAFQCWGIFFLGYAILGLEG